MTEALNGSGLALRAFWICFIGIVYSYAGYPLVVWVLARSRLSSSDSDSAAQWEFPEVTLIVPVHNENATIVAKLENTTALDYPPGRLKAVFVSDGSTDGTVEAIAARRNERISLLQLPGRQGKAAALNAGLAAASTPIVVFSDASIMLEFESIKAIVRPFGSAVIGCVSGEDRIAGGGGEGLYGQYEMFLRRQESRLHSLVGASGSFYAQRRNLCGVFIPNVAPDFLSVLRTVKAGHRAVSAPEAVGYMRAVGAQKAEFERKVRTILRGLTTLGAHLSMLNPVRYPVFAFELFSHKLMRWLVPFLLIGLLVSSAWLAADSIFYAVMLGLQVAAYAMAALMFFLSSPSSFGSLGRIISFFCVVNLATLLAWWKYALGTRQETWGPSKR